MKRLAALLVAATAVLAPSAAVAAPVASFTVASDPGTTLVVGTTYTLDGTASHCDLGVGCKYEWSWTYTTSRGQTLVGGQLGTNPTATLVASTEMAAKPLVTVKLKVTQAGGTNNYALASRSFVVRYPAATVSAGRIYKWSELNDAAV